MGGGRFLTEVMDEIHTIIKQLNESGGYKPSIKEEFEPEMDRRIYD